MHEKHRKGELACLKAEERALDLGAIVSKPTTEQKYDRVIDWNGRLYRVQIKFISKNRMTRSTGAIEVDQRKHGKLYCDNGVDVMLVYSEAQDKMFWIPVEMMRGRATTTFRYAPSANNQTAKCNDLWQYEWK